MTVRPSVLPDYAARATNERKITARRARTIVNFLRGRKKCTTSRLV